jgi:hypothetical protein
MLVIARFLLAAMLVIARFLLAAMLVIARFFNDDDERNTRGQAPPLTEH